MEREGGRVRIWGGRTQGRQATSGAMIGLQENHTLRVIVIKLYQGVSKCAGQNIWRPVGQTKMRLSNSDT